MTRLPNFLKSRPEDMGLRHIKTARSVEEMNDAAKRGFRPILRQVVQNPEIRARFQVIQNHSTGEVRHLADYRSRFDAAEWGVVIPWTDYYPYLLEGAICCVPHPCRHRGWGRGYAG